MYSSVGIVSVGGSYRSTGRIGIDDAFTERPRLRLSDPACAGKDMTLWIDPQSPASFQNALKQNKVALDICRSCPVRLGCLEWALANEECGLWGGCLEVERADAIKNGVTAEELIALDKTRLAVPVEPDIGWRARSVNKERLKRHAEKRRQNQARVS